MEATEEKGMVEAGGCKEEEEDLEEEEEESDALVFDLERAFASLLS
jgi:hypothetical protein